MIRACRIYTRLSAYQWLLLCTLWCQIFCGPRFSLFGALRFLFRPPLSLQALCGFYSERVFYNKMLHQTCYFKCFKVGHPPVSFIWTHFYLKSGVGFLLSTHAVFIQAVVLLKLPKTLLFCPCAQFCTIEQGRVQRILTQHLTIILCDES